MHSNRIPLSTHGKIHNSILQNPYTGSLTAMSDNYIVIYQGQFNCRIDFLKTLSVFYKVVINHNRYQIPRLWFQYRRFFSKFHQARYVACVEFCDTISYLTMWCHNSTLPSRDPPAKIYVLFFGLCVEEERNHETIFKHHIVSYIHTCCVGLISNTCTMLRSLDKIYWEELRLPDIQKPDSSFRGCVLTLDILNTCKDFKIYKDYSVNCSISNTMFDVIILQHRCRILAYFIR